MIQHNEMREINLESHPGANVRLKSTGKGQGGGGDRWCLNRTGETLDSP